MTQTLLRGYWMCVFLYFILFFIIMNYMIFSWSLVLFMRYEIRRRETRGESTEVEERETELQSRNFNFNLNFLSSSRTNKTKKIGHQRRLGLANRNRSKVTKGHPPENRNFYFPRRTDTESRFKRPEGKWAQLTITVVTEYYWRGPQYNFYC